MKRDIAKRLDRLEGPKKGGVKYAICPFMPGHEPEEFHLLPIEKWAEKFRFPTEKEWIAKFCKRTEHCYDHAPFGQAVSQEDDPLRPRPRRRRKAHAEATRDAPKAGIAHARAFGQGKYKGRKRQMVFSLNQTPQEAYRGLRVA